MKNQILIGSDLHGKAVHFDIERLITTRLLLCANSGGGKSWLIRRIAEELHGTMPVIIIDPEGEFASLREKFSFVLVGKGGETPADCRSAKLLAHKLLELRASAVIDLSEMGLADRHRFVRLFSEAAINSPKELWRPTAFIFDEVHEFCPENGKGSSEAKNAVLGFPTKGRKRHFLSIFATQRVHKLALDARAEMLNRMIGQTFEPDDMKVAASILGVDKDGMADFKHKMRTMDAGLFYAFGRAVSLETILVKVGAVQTSHEVGESKYGVSAPPTPDKIKAMLPQLADLPKEAEEAEQSLATLKSENRRLTQELAQAKTQQVPDTNDRENALLAFEEIQKQIVSVDAQLDEAEKLTTEANRQLRSLQIKVNFYFEGFKATKQPTRSTLPTLGTGTTIPRLPSPSRKMPPVVASTESNGLGRMEKSFLTALAQHPEGLSKGQILTLTDYRASGPVSKTFAAIGREGWVENDGVRLKITDSGLSVLGPYEALPTGPELREYVLNSNKVSQMEKAMLRCLFHAYPEPITKGTILSATGYAASGPVSKSFARLVRIGWAKQQGPSLLKASENFFS